jgi:hypothetical protein
MPSDLRHALRGLRRSPAYALTAIACLALGIAANTAVFSMVNAILLRPFPFAGGERLTSLYATAPDGELYGLAMEDVQELRASTRAFDAVEGVSGRGRIIIGEQTYEAIKRDDANLATTCIEQLSKSLKGFHEAVKHYEVPWKPSSDAAGTKGVPTASAAPSATEPVKT